MVGSAARALRCRGTNDLDLVKAGPEVAWPPLPEQRANRSCAALVLRVVGPGPAPEPPAIGLGQPAAHADDRLELVDGRAVFDPLAEALPHFLDHRHPPTLQLVASI